MRSSARGGAAAICMALSCACAAEVLAAAARWLLRRRAPVPRRVPSKRCAAIWTGIGLLPVGFCVFTGDDERGIALAVLVCVASHLPSRPLERAFGVIAARAGSSGSPYLCFLATAFACLSPLRLRFGRASALLVVVVLASL